MILFKNGDKLTIEPDYGKILIFNRYCDQTISDNIGITKIEFIRRGEYSLQGKLTEIDRNFSNDDYTTITENIRTIDESEISTDIISFMTKLGENDAKI